VRSKEASVVFILLCLIWGSTWLGIKVGLEYLPPFLFAGMRFGVASLALLPLGVILKARIPRDRSSWAHMLLLGILQITVPYGLVFWGEQYISSGLASVLFATLPFFVVIFAQPLIPDERLTVTKILGITASFIGLVLIFWQDLMGGITASVFGGLAIVGSAASGGFSNVFAKRYTMHIDPATNILVQSAVSFVLLTGVGLLTETSSDLSFTYTAVAALLYLGVVGSAFAFVGLYWLLKRATATNTSLLAFITPIVALILGWLVLGETLTLNLSAGTALILAGVYFTVRPSARS